MLSKITAQSIQQQFREALATLMEEVKADHSIVAAILCGSLSHDAVWAKSDIDLVLVTLDERKSDKEGVSLNADGVNVHAFLISRGEFRHLVEGSLHQSFMHSFLTKGKLLYSHDPTIETLMARLGEIGERDTQIQLLRAATGVLPPLYKAHKFFQTRGDLEYTALWLLATASPLAQVEVISARLLADREVIPQAQKLNPALFKIIYSDLLNAKKTKHSMQVALDAVDRYMAERAKTLFAPLLEHLSEVGEVRSCTEIVDHCKRNFGVADVTTACEYLADLGLLVKAAAPVKLTKKSNVEVQELAFFSLK